MVATLQRALFLSMLALAAAVCALLARFGFPWWGLGAGLSVAFIHAPILAVEFFCLRWVEAKPARPAVRRLFHAWLVETFTTPLVFWWRQPFRSHALKDHLPCTPTGRRGVLLVHGLLCNRGFWNPWMRQLQRGGCPYLAIDLEPAFAPIDAYVDAIEDGVARLRSCTGVAPVIVAHSMGGLAVRLWLQDRLASQRVHRIITIGTPHHGTWLARFSRSASGRQMSTGSAWLQALAAGEPLSGYQCFTCFYGTCDNVVFPSKNAQLPGADNRRIDSTGHVALAFKDEVYAEALRYVDSGVDPPAG